MLPSRAALSSFSTFARHHQSLTVSLIFMTPPSWSSRCRARPPSRLARAAQRARRRALPEIEEVADLRQQLVALLAGLAGPGGELAALLLQGGLPRSEDRVELLGDLGALGEEGLETGVV